MTAKTEGGDRRREKNKSLCVRCNHDVCVGGVEPQLPSDSSVLLFQAFIRWKQGARP